jgi:phage host-nuclease inhibitor protein Gam
MRASLQHDEMLERKIKEGLEARASEAEDQSHLKEEMATQIDALQKEVKTLSESLEQHRTELNDVDKSEAAVAQQQYVVLGMCCM